MRTALGWYALHLLQDREYENKMIQPIKESIWIQSDKVHSSHFPSCPLWFPNSMIEAIGQLKQNIGQPQKSSNIRLRAQYYFRRRRKPGTVSLGWEYSSKEQPQGLRQSSPDNHAKAFPDGSPKSLFPSFKTSPASWVIMPPLAVNLQRS